MSQYNHAGYTFQSLRAAEKCIDLETEKLYIFARGASILTQGLFEHLKLVASLKHSKGRIQDWFPELVRELMGGVDDELLDEILRKINCKIENTLTDKELSLNDVRVIFNEMYSFHVSTIVNFINKKV